MAQQLRKGGKECSFAPLPSTLPMAHAGVATKTNGLQCEEQAADFAPNAVLHRMISKPAHGYQSSLLAAAVAERIALLGKLSLVPKPDPQDTAEGPTASYLSFVLLPSLTRQEWWDPCPLKLVCTCRQLRNQYDNSPRPTLHPTPWIFIHSLHHSGQRRAAGEEGLATSHRPRHSNFTRQNEVSGCEISLQILTRLPQPLVGKS